MIKIPIIVNPFSKKNKRMRGNSVDTIKKIGGEYVDVKSTGSLEELDEIALESCVKKVPYIAISGGDGTIHQVLSRIINVYTNQTLPPLLILKDGTMNNISATIGNRGNGYRILKRFVKAVKRATDIQLVVRNTMKIEDRYCFLFGTGLTTNILNAVYEGGNKDLPKVVKVIIKAFSDGIINPNNSVLFKRFKAKVILNGVEIPCDDLLGILAGTVENIGMGFKPLTRNGSGNKTFHVIATGVKPIELARKLLVLKSGKSFQHPLHYDSHVEEIKIESDEPFVYTMDGDLYTSAGKLKVETGPLVQFVVI